MNSLTTDGGSSRVSIPRELLKTLQSIREMSGKEHSDEDIYAAYKECLNDPVPTAERLCHLDTYHRVRNKKEKKKESVLPIAQARGGRTGWRNFASSNRYYQGNGRRESGANHVTRASRTSPPATNKERNLTVPRAAKVSGPPTSYANGVNKNHKVENDISATTVNKIPLVASVEIPEPVTAPVVQNNIQDVISVNSQSSELQSLTFSRQESSASHSSSRSLVKSDDLGERPHVTFPIHLQIAEGMQNGLTFGSFDSNFVKEVSSIYDSKDVESSQGTEDVERDSPSPPTANGIPGTFSASEAELMQHSDHVVPPIEGELREGALLNTQQTHQIAYGQEASFSVFGLAPSFPAVGQPINTQVAEEIQPGNSNATGIPLASYPPEQQAAHIFRQQQYPPFYPYPYYPPFYMPPPPYIHPFVSPNGIPQQPYFPLAPPPAHLTPAAGDTENPPTSNPSHHVPSAVATHITSPTALNEERTSPMAETAAAWIGQGLGNMQLNPMYNLALYAQQYGYPFVQAGHGGLMGVPQTQPLAALPLPPLTTTTVVPTEPIGNPPTGFSNY